jgi:DNA-binding CsgD family transcriptional regulator/tetratricopeptide (TPR) repeat protein
VLVTAADGYWFRHALVAEALVAEALPGERIPLHRRLADALEAEPVGGPSADRAADGQRWAELAHHRFAAHDFEPALVASVRAGLAAERMFAHIEALRQFERAIGLWYDAPGAHAAADLDLVGLRHRAADAAYLVGDTKRAITLIRGAIEDTDDPTRKGMLYERNGRYLLTGGSPPNVAIEAHRRAVALVPDRPTRHRARVLAGLAGMLMLDHRFAEARAVAERTLAASRAAGAREEEGHALSTLGLCLIALGDAGTGIRHLRAALEIARDADRVEDLHRSYANLSDALRSTGALAEAASVALEGAASAEWRGTGWTYGDILLANATDALFLSGRWAEALALLPEIPQARGFATSAATLSLSAARVFGAAGRSDAAERHVAAALEWMSAGVHANLRVPAATVLAERALDRDRPAEALRELDAVAWVLDGAAAEPYAANLVALAVRAAGDLRLAAGPDAVPPVDRYAAWITGFPASSGVPAEALSLHALAVAELTRLTDEPDPAAWAAAAARWKDFGSPYHRAYALWREAEARLRDRHGRRAARQRLVLAAGIAADLGAAPLRRRVEALAARARLDLTTAPRPADAPAPYGLTPREREVLELLATGRTNREIARTLFISERTVGIHVSHILGKLGVGNRAAAGAVAHRDGMVAGAER